MWMSHLRCAPFYALLAFEFLTFPRQYVVEAAPSRELLVEARGFKGVLWSHTFSGGLARTLVGDVKQHHFLASQHGTSTIFPGEQQEQDDAVSSDADLRDKASEAAGAGGGCDGGPRPEWFTALQIRLESFEDAEGVKHRFPAPAPTTEQVATEESATLEEFLQDDTLPLALVFRVAWRSEATSPPVTKLVLQIVAQPCCFTEKGWKIVSTLLAPRVGVEKNVGLAQDAEEVARLLGSLSLSSDEEAARGRRAGSSRRNNLLRAALRRTAAAVRHLPPPEVTAPIVAAALGTAVREAWGWSLHRLYPDMLVNSNSDVEMQMSGEADDEAAGGGPLGTTGTAARPLYRAPMCPTWAVLGLCGLAVLRWLSALEQNRSDAAAAEAAARPLVDAVAGVFFCKPGRPAPWAPSWEVAFSAWQKSWKPLFQEFRAHVTRVQYYSDDEGEDCCGEAQHDVDGCTKDQKTYPTLLRREVVVEKYYNHIHARWLADDLPPWTRTEKHHFADDTGGRHRRFDVEVEPPKGRHGLDLNDDPPELLCGEGEPRRRPSAALYGAAWFGLPTCPCGRGGAGEMRMGTGNDEEKDFWLPVGEPKLFHEVNMAAFLEVVMTQQLQIQLREFVEEGDDDKRTRTSRRREVSLRWRGDEETSFGFGRERRASAEVVGKPIRRGPLLSNSREFSESNSRNIRSGSQHLRTSEKIWTSTVPEYGNNREEFRPRCTAMDAATEYILVHFARNSDASLLAEYTVTVDRHDGIMWRLRIFRPAWAAMRCRAEEAQAPHDSFPPCRPQLMQDSVLHFSFTQHRCSALIQHIFGTAATPAG